MIRISSINISDNKQVVISLTNIYGIGISRARNICKLHNINFHLKIKDLTDFQLNNIRNEINKLLIEGDLKRQININIKRLIDIKCYRGIRHVKKLPLRGQRTRTNARTKKGPRKLLFIKK